MMYNRNYGGFDYVQIRSKLLTSVLNRKLAHINPKDYMRPLNETTKKTFSIEKVFKIYFSQKLTFHLYDLANVVLAIVLAFLFLS